MIRFRLWRFRCYLYTFFWWYVGIMSRRWTQNPNRCADEYLDGIENFIDDCTYTQPRCNYNLLSL
ncbi:unnamed protein product [Prunus brigantina]